MKIVLNGEPQMTAAATLAELCTSLGLSEAKIATAVNGDFVPARKRPGLKLAEDDKVEIVAPRQGG
ncbi:MAG: sulfur carrier protein ThiS [Methyloligellaceae bacterium]